MVRSYNPRIRETFKLEAKIGRISLETSHSTTESNEYGFLQAFRILCLLKLTAFVVIEELHRTETAFKRITHTDACRRICEDLKVTNPIVPQSMYILKEARVGAEVSPHQDSTFLFTTPKLSCTAFWIPLENATTENGCLWVIPKSQTEPIRTRFKMADDGSGGAQYDPVIGDTWKIWPKDLFTAVPVSAGSLVLLHGSIIHMSLENLSDKPRHVYTWHVVSGDQKFEPDNWMGPGPFHPV